MTQVSKKFIAAKLEGKVYQTFWEAICKIKKGEEASDFFSALFTKTERINFIKRLSIAVLLHKGYEWRHIEDLLKVSTATIARVYMRLPELGFKIFFEKIEKEEEWKEFFKELGKLYLVVTHPDKVARLGSEGAEKI